MLRVLLTTMILLMFAVVAHAIYIPGTDLEPFSSPCGLEVTENGSTRTLSWSSVSGVSIYKVGRIPDGESVVGLAQTNSTSYDDTAWDSQECYEYVVIAYDANEKKICSAHVENVGTCLE